MWRVRPNAFACGNLLRHEHVGRFDEGHEITPADRRRIRRQRPRPTGHFPGATLFARTFFAPRLVT